jgi:hypothetical protein
LIPYRAASVRSVCESPTIAYLVVLYSVFPRHGTNPLMEADFVYDLLGEI